MMPILHRAHENTVSLAYSTAQYSEHLLKEIAKVSAVYVCLIQIGKHYLVPINPSMKDLVLVYVIIAPVMEEIIFRGILLRTIERMQWLKNKILIKDKPTETHLKTQEVFRVRVTSVLFGACHLQNYPELGFGGTLYQCVNTTFLGISWGYMAEKYQTISLSILAHGLNNVLVTKIILEFSKDPNLSKGYLALHAIGIRCLHLFFHVLGTTPILENTLSKGVAYVQNETKSLCGKLKRKINYDASLTSCA